MFGVYFPDDLLSPSSRRSIYYQRSSPSYTPGEHASPAGSIWVDTSFMSDCNYDLLGGTQNEDEEAEEHRKKRNDYANEMLQLRGNDFIDDGMNMVFGEEVEGMEPEEITRSSHRVEYPATSFLVSLAEANRSKGNRRDEGRRYVA
jgi:hypothetical protein